MADLLIHSMCEFSDIILPGLAVAGVENIVEIGAEFGGMTTLLAAYCKERGGHLTSIDPAPKPEFIHWVSNQPNVEHVPLPSLDAISTLRNVDAWVIDGDHNWYTVYNELKMVRDVCRRDGKPFLAFLHDIGWPSGRRDMYYAPDRIPAAFRHPHSFDGGCNPGYQGLREHRGFRGMGHFAFALHEGGPRNGVLTAVEDFAAEELEAGVPYGLAEVPGVFGLGVLFDLDADWSGLLAQMLEPWHQNRLLQTLESNRLLNYLEIIERQDQAIARVAAA